MPRRAAYPWGAGGKEPWGACGAVEGSEATELPDRTATTFKTHPRSVEEEATACNKSPDLTPGQCCHSAEG